MTWTLLSSYLALTLIAQAMFLPQLLDLWRGGRTRAGSRSSRLGRTLATFGGGAFLVVMSLVWVLLTVLLAATVDRTQDVVLAIALAAVGVMPALGYVVVSVVQQLALERWLLANVRSMTCSSERGHVVRALRSRGLSEPVADLVVTTVPLAGVLLWLCASNPLTTFDSDERVLAMYLGLAALLLVSFFVWTVSDLLVPHRRLVRLLCLGAGRRNLQAAAKTHRRLTGNRLARMPAAWRRPHHRVAEATRSMLLLIDDQWAVAAGAREEARHLGTRVIMATFTSSVAVATETLKGAMARYPVAIPEVELPPNRRKVLVASITPERLSASSQALLTALTLAAFVVVAVNSKFDLVEMLRALQG